jgi:hypothetical protein
MYSVVGCPECSAFKIVEDRPETTQCPRCGRQTKFEKLRTFYQSDELDAAREIRARMLAERSGHSEAYNELGDFAELDSLADEAGMSGEEYLEHEGFNTETIAEAGERAMSGTGTGSDTSRSKKKRVLDALRDLDRPTEEEVIERADEVGVPAEYVRDALDKLARHGEVTENDGRYRLL